jgi:hypothetical protein
MKRVEPRNAVSKKRKTQFKICENNFWNIAKHLYLCNPKTNGKKRERRLKALIKKEAESYGE